MLTMVQFDCSDVFPHYDSADCVVINNSARIRLFKDGEHIHISMDVDRLANFLDKCRQQQEPRIRHLA